MLYRRQLFLYNVGVVNNKRLESGKKSRKTSSNSVNEASIHRLRVYPLGIYPPCVWVGFLQLLWLYKTVCVWLTRSKKHAFSAAVGLWTVVLNGSIPLKWTMSASFLRLSHRIKITTSMAARLWRTKSSCVKESWQKIGLQLAGPRSHPCWFYCLLEPINILHCWRVIWPQQDSRLFSFPLDTKARCWWVLVYCSSSVKQ